MRTNRVRLSWTSAVRGLTIAALVGTLALFVVHRVLASSQESQRDASPADLKEGNAVASDTAVESKHTNHLIDETSPYLLQHAHNPVDWYPWGDEAIERARSEDKPIFLSIGYSACHWCHVMERESFESEEIAAILNEHFISIKVDREERPDLDDIYMKAVQMLTGSGGWPMTVFLTPDLEPFYGGTYFPPRDMYGRPGFKTVLLGISQVWRERRDEAVRGAQEIAGHIRSMVPAESPADVPLDAAPIAAATAELARAFDATHGGFGGAPKFPSAPAIAILFRQYRHTGDEELREMAEFTLRRMANGGMYDHLGGGFHRYSVDEKWLVPHFEKMLYDNAQLSEAYLEAFQLTGDAFYRRIAEEIFEYELRDMQDPSGAFHATEDADSEGQEGKFYVWARDEITSILGEEDASLFCTYYGVREEGNFSSHEPYHEGLNILHVPRPMDEVAAEAGLTISELEAKLLEMRARLLEVRSQRTRPGLDDKILTSWNALMISSFAKGCQVLGDDRYRTAAERAARFILTDVMRDGRLLRTHRHGESRLPGYLDDYAFMVAALVDLYEATFDPAWLAEATKLADTMIAQFWDPEEGGFFFTSPDHKDLIARVKPSYDGAEPSGNSMAALGLLRLAKLAGNEDYADKAARTLRMTQRNMARAPQAYLKMLVALDFHLNPPQEIAIVGPAGDEAVAGFLQTTRGTFHPNRVVAFLDPSWDNKEALERQIPLLAGKDLHDGQPAVYVCENFTCRQPVTSNESLLDLLGSD